MFKLKNKLILGVTILGIAFFVGCNKDFIEPLPENETKNLILGEKLKNPYSVGNMKIALSNLKTNNKSSGIEIKTTHYYVKFKPNNDEDLSLLKQDTLLDLYDYPLDRKVIQGQTAYHDPEIPINQPTYLYCAVKVDYIFPEIEYEILEDLYIPEETEGLKNNNFLIENLVDEALRITSNIDALQSNSSNNKSIKNSNWTPAGTILAWDDNLGQTTVTNRVFSHWECYNCDTGDPIYPCPGDGPLPLRIIEPIDDDVCKRAVYTYVTTTVDGSYVPVEGVIVRARNWFTTRKGTTGSNGEYTCDGDLGGSANYSIIWERYNFEIRDSWLGRAKYEGPEKTGDWNLNIRHGAQEFYSTIFRAAYHYYYANIRGLRRPPLNAVFNTQLKIRAFNESNDDVNGIHCAGCRFLGLGSAIKMYNPQRNSRDIYGTIIHEMAHASHWCMDSWHYSNADTIVVESWARGVQWELTRMVHTSYQPGYARLNYTGIVQDMIDGFGIKATSTWYDYSTENWGSPPIFMSYLDQVEGYTIRQIEDALIGERYWDNWEINIKNKYNNGTENNLDATFSYWNTK